MANSNVARPSEAVYRFCGPRYRCAYCGEPADSIDHTTPRWFVAGNYQLIKRYDLIKVTACRDCNVRASGIVDKTFSQRKERIAKSVFGKYRRYLITADWPEEELDELGFNLRTLVENASCIASVVRRRLIFLHDINWPRGVPEDLQILKSAYLPVPDDDEDECHDKILTYGDF